MFNTAQTTDPHGGKARLELNPQFARKFLQALYGRFFSHCQGAAYLEIRHKREGGDIQRKFYPDPEALLKDMPRWEPTHNYWIGVSPRSNNKRGKKEDLLALLASYADLDCGAAGHKGATKYQTKIEVQTAVEHCPLRPSILIDSGGGLQAHWLFREPVQPLNGNLARIEAVLKGIAVALGGDPMNAAQILRLPGTYNMKLADNPRPVTIVWCEPDRVYDLTEIEQWAEQFRGHEQTSRSNRQGSHASEYEDYAQKALAEELANLARTPEGSHYRNNQLNKSAFSLGQLVGAGVLDKGKVEAALYGMALSIGLSEPEIRATIRSGVEDGIKEPRKLAREESQGKKGGRTKTRGVSG